MCKHDGVLCRFRFGLCQDAFIEPRLGMGIKQYRAGFIRRAGLWASGKERQRTGALQDASRNSPSTRNRFASWSAAALRRFRCHDAERMRR